MGHTASKEHGHTAPKEASPKAQKTTPPEMTDYLRCKEMTEQNPDEYKLFGIKMPDILPSDADLARMTPADIGKRLSTYRGIPLEELEANLKPGGMSDGGFLDPEQKLGEVIHADATWLHSVGVDRHSIADKLDMLLAIAKYEDEYTMAKKYYGPDEERDAGFKVFREQIAKKWGAVADEQDLFSRTPDFPFIALYKNYRGYQEDPFHSESTNELLRKGDSECIIINKKKMEEALAQHGGKEAFFKDQTLEEDLTYEQAELLVSKTDCGIMIADLIVVFIQRVCFFEGSKSYRVDPKKLAKLLDLLQE